MAGERSIIRRIISVFDRPSADKAQSEMVESLAQGGEKAGKKAGENFIRDLRAEFNKRKAELSEALARGTIDQKEFKKQTDLAARTFNEGLLKGIERARREGRLTDGEYVKLTRTLKRVGNDGARDVGRLGAAMERLRSIALTATAAFASLWVVRRVADFGKALFRLGSQVLAVGNQFNVVFGEKIGALLRERTRDLQLMAGLTRRQAEEALAGAGSMAQGFGMAKDASADFAEQVLELSADLASFNNVGTADALALVQSAIIGNTEAARSLKVSFTALDVQHRALEMTGKRTASELTQEEKALAALAVMTERAGPMIGDLARTQNDADNVAKQLSGSWNQLKESLAALVVGGTAGELHLEALRDLLRDLDRWVNANAETIQLWAARLVRAIGEVIARLDDLVRAIMVAGAVAAFVRLRAAVIAVNGAAVAFSVTLRGMLALIGPTGWIVLGITALTELFHRLGRATRESAAALDEWEASLSSMSLEELYHELQEVDKQKRQVEAQLQHFQQSGQKRLADDAERRLEIIRQGGYKIIALINRLQNQVQPGSSGAAGEPGPTPEDAPAGADAEAEALARLQAQREALIQQMSRDIDVNNRRAAATLQGEEAVEALNRALYIEDALLQSGADAGSQFAATIAALAGAQYDAAEAAKDAADTVETAWTEAFQAMEAEARAMEMSIASVVQAFAAGGFAGLARLAKAKVVENLAWAAENFAKAMGWVALGNVPSAAVAKAAAKGHLVAAAKWGGAAVAFGGAGGGGGGSSKDVAGGSAPPTGQAGRAEKAGPEVHIYFDGPGFDAVNPRVQRVVAGAHQYYQERYGPNAKIKTHRRSGG